MLAIRLAARVLPRHSPSCGRPLHVASSRLQSTQTLEERSMTVPAFGGLLEVTSPCSVEVGAVDVNVHSDMDKAFVQVTDYH